MLVLWLGMGSLGALFMTRASNSADSRDTIAVLDSSAAAVASEQQRLVTICGDWAPWDDSYYFVRHPTRTYVANNLSDQSVLNLNIDFMIFCDASGRTVYSKSLDPNTHRPASLPDGMVRLLATKPAFLSASNPRVAVFGAVALREGPYMIAAQPIGKSDLSGAPDGTLVVGFRVDHDVLSTIQNLTSRPIDIYSSTAPTLAPDVQAAFDSLEQSESNEALVVKKDVIVAYRIIDGVGGGPGLVMRVASPRTAYAEARSAILGWGLAMSAFGVAVVMMLGLTLDRTVLKRLTRLSDAVAEIGSSTDAGHRVEVSGTDEISDLAVAVNRMLDELGTAESEMAFLVDHDVLTGLYNRRYFENELQREIADNQRIGVQGAILWFDLDHFKEINDSLGHSAGDELLTAFGQHLQAETRAYCTVARLGGDEFAMLIPDTQGEEAVAAAIRLIEGFTARTFRVGAHDLRVSASAGVVLYPKHGTRSSELLARADIAMYDAKAKGGNQVVAYADGDSGHLANIDRLEATERILSAMREDRVVLYAQPIRGSSDENVESFELLLRIRDEEGGLVLPSSIIPTAERLGLVREIDRWVVRRAIHLLELAQRQGRDVRFSVNLSGSALSDAPLLDIAKAEFADTGAAPERLTMEISESTALANMDGAVRFARTLKDIGCRFSLDGFGSPASSYYYLKHLPVDFLKIDGSLVTGVSVDSTDAGFVHAIVEMCHRLKIRTVAEYVENEQALNAIKRTGVDFVQGYVVGTPEPLDFYLGEEFAESEWGGSSQADGDTGNTSG